MVSNDAAVTVALTQVCSPIVTKSRSNVLSLAAASEEEPTHAASPLVMQLL